VILTVHLPETKNCRRVGGRRPSVKLLLDAAVATSRSNGTVTSSKVILSFSVAWFVATADPFLLFLTVNSWSMSYD